MREQVVEQLKACLRTLDEHGLNVAAAHLCTAIESIQAELQDEAKISIIEDS